MQNAGQLSIRLRSLMNKLLRLLLKKYRLVLLIVLGIILLHISYSWRYLAFSLIENVEIFMYDQNGGVIKSAGYRNKNSKIFCMILTAPKNLETKAPAVNLTWATQCDMYKFITIIPKNASYNLPLLQPDRKLHLKVYNMFPQESL